MSRTPHHTRAILVHIHEYISGQGFYYPKQDLANFYLSLKTKPFVILAGISGTGKSQLARLFAQALGKQAHCQLIPVRPDWTSQADLLGYMDLNGNFQAQSMLRMILKAHKHPKELFFVILDEMNLARVEYYFSDFLSIMESRRKEKRKIVTDPILRATNLPEKHKWADLTIPENLYFVGTVNMDETTHPFSRKVLDRTQSIEMSEVQLDWPPDTEEIGPLDEIYSDFLKPKYLHIKDIRKKDKDKLRPNLIQLMEINEKLKAADLHFGYRVRDEIAFYLLNRYEISELITEREAMDFQIVQKILPRIHGSSRRIGTLLFELIDLLSPDNIELNPNWDYLQINKAIMAAPKNTLRYPRSLHKLQLMYRRFEEDGFCSFWV